MTTRNEFIRGPKRRTQVTPRQRHVGATLTAVPILALGAILMYAAIWGLGWLGAPDWLRWAPWWLPTLGALAWTSGRPAPAVASDDDDDSWSGFAIRWVLVGEEMRRPLPLRLVSALAFGAPASWAIGLSLLGALAGVF